MSVSPSRRFILSGMLASAVSALGPRARAEAPLTSMPPMRRGARSAPPDADALIDAARLGGAVGFLAVDMTTGRVIDAHDPDLRLPPASVAKAATAYYALSRLAPDWRFETRIVATAPLVDGRIDGDLILVAGGDPHLDTDQVADMVARLKARGLREITGRFRVDARALPTLRDIDPEQPDHVGYNPALSGMILNFNRVHFEWKRSGADYDVTMQARAARYSPHVRSARMDLIDRAAPIYTYDDRDGVDRWTVARGALGGNGSRWLPVRRPADYVADVFLTLARSHGIVLRRGPDVARTGDAGTGDAGTGDAAGEVLVLNRSDTVASIARSMLLYSTNITAEALGLTATRETDGSATSLIGSARHMNRWLNGPVGCRSTGFVDHSGLGYGSRVSAADMVHLLRAAAGSGLPDLMKAVKTDVPGAVVRAKTGTLNFVSALAGYVLRPSGDPICFAIFTADMPRRDAIPVAQRERPDGARGWAGRSRSLQGALIARWVALAAA